MRHSPTAFALILFCAGSSLLAQSEAGYRANIGKTAVSAATGVEIGTIVDAALANGVWVYRVNRGGRITTVPVDAVRETDAAPPAVRPPAAAVRQPAPVKPSGRVDAMLIRTATEFRHRLAQGGGTLQSLVLTSKGLSAAWTSAKCDAFDPEVIGLVQSITKTQKASPAIAGARTCGTDVRTFAITGATIDRYRNGVIGDPQLRAAITQPVD